MKPFVTPCCKQVVPPIAEGHPVGVRACIKCGQGYVISVTREGDRTWGAIVFEETAT